MAKIGTIKVNLDRASSDILTDENERTGRGYSEQIRHALGVVDFLRKHTTAGGHVYIGPPDIEHEQFERIYLNE